jgi:uncharacterized membrane protein YphA (DoxX/SURF4 family)
MIFSSKTWRAIALVLRIALGAVFAYAAWLKLRVPWQLFAGAIGDYKVLPDWAVAPLARTLPWAELLLGALLILGLWRRMVATAITLLLAGFFTLLVRAFALHMDISCGCFGPTGDPISWRTLLRDGSLLAVSLAVTWMSYARPREASRPASLPDAPGQ